MMEILDEMDSGILHNYITLITGDCSKILIFHCSKPSIEKQVSKKYCAPEGVCVVSGCKHGTDDNGGWKREN